jgi:hypothetical protein
LKRDYKQPAAWRDLAAKNSIVHTNVVWYIGTHDG